MAQTLQGQTNACLNEGSGLARFSGGGYGFLSRKRGEIGAREDAQCGAETQACSSSVKPDVLVLEDESTKFAISDMPENLLTELVRANMQPL